MGRVANWDTGLGYQLYCEGRSDGEIADACKVKTSTITSYRLKRWRKNPDGGRNAPTEREVRHCEEGEARRGSPVDHAAAEGTPAGVDGIATSPAAPRNDVEESEGKEVAGMPENKNRETARMMEVIAKMTEGMGGIEAVCVGNIIQSLWNLNSVDDVRNARNILDWLEEFYDFG